MKRRGFWISLIFAIVLSVLSVQYMRPSKTVTDIPFSTFLRLLSLCPSQLSALKVTANTISFSAEGKGLMRTRIVKLAPDMLSKLTESGVTFYTPPESLNVFGFVYTLAYAGFMWSLVSKTMQGPQDSGAGKRKDQQLLGSLSFDDIAGQDKAKREVAEVCEMLKNPLKYRSIGARLPSGVLLVGPPGTGKTLLARVAAAEAGVPFYACSASDFVEVFVGRGPARVRKLFQTAAETAPSIVFIDELDSIGRSRRLGSMNSEQENTLNQILTCMDGLDTSNNGVIVMAATNRYELLDPALLRAGRFDRIVQCPLPDKQGREKILSVHTKKLRVDETVDLERIARFTAGTCGADLAAICNEAAIRTARRGGYEVSFEDFDDALRNFYSSRGAPLSSLVEGIQIPEWLKQFSGKEVPATGLTN